MEVFSCVAAAASLGRNCLSTIKSLHNLYDKYHNAHRTIAALHSEVSVIGVSMQFVNVIFEEHQEAIKRRFTKIPELEQTFAAALAGCNLVLSCLDEDIEKILSRLGSQGSGGRRGRARVLWREDAMQDLLHTLRGQQSAIFSIIQCLHLQNIAQLGEKIDDLRAKVSQNHQNVEHAVRRSPSVVNLRPAASTETEEPALMESTSESQSKDPTELSAPSLCGTRSTGSSSERVSSSYRQYYATLSKVSIPQASGAQSVAETVKWSDDRSDDGTASVLGLAPSTVMGLNNRHDDDQTSDKQSTISLVLTLSRTREWLEALSLSENSTGLRPPRSTIAPSEISADEIEHSIVASDMESFLEHIRYFMPVLAESDDGKEVHEAHEEQPNQDSSYEGEMKMLTTQNPATDDDGRLDAHIFENHRPSTGVPCSEPTHEADSIPAEVDTEHNSPQGANEDDMDVDAPDALHGSSEEVVQNDTSAPIDSSEPNTAAKPQGEPYRGLSVYAPKRQYRPGPVIDSSNCNSDNTRRISYGFGQAFASGTQDLPSNTLRVIFVQRPTRSIQSI